MLAIAVLSGYGLRSIAVHTAGIKRQILIGACMGAVLLEYFSAPLPFTRVPVGDTIPQVYQWLARVEPNSVVLELPLYDPNAGMNYTIEAPRVYYSTYHWKKLMNGYSGYHPPLMDELNRRINHQSLQRTIADFQRLGIDYLILHKDLCDPQAFHRLHSGLSKDKNQIRFVNHFDSAYVYKVKKAPGLAVRSNKNRRYTSLPRTDWRATSNTLPSLAPNAIDGDRTSRWHSGPQATGVFFQLDMGTVQPISGFSLFLKKNISDYPPAFSVHTSVDGEQWKTVLHNQENRPDIRSFIHPSNLDNRIGFQTVSARYIKIKLTDSEPPYYWSIYDMDVFFC